MLFNTTHCNTQLPEVHRSKLGCVSEPKLMTFVQYSSYAAQIAWWLAFFPPEQFLVLTISELRDPARRVKVRSGHAISLCLMCGPCLQNWHSCCSLVIMLSICELPANVLKTPARLPASIHFAYTCAVIARTTGMVEHPA